MPFSNIKGYHPKWAAMVWREVETLVPTWVDRIMTPAETVAELVVTMLGKVSPVRRSDGPFEAESLAHYEFTIKSAAHAHGVKIRDIDWIRNPGGVMQAKRAEVGVQARHHWRNAIIEAMMKAHQTPGPLDTYQIHTAHKWSPLKNITFSNDLQFDLKDALNEMDKPGLPQRPTVKGIRWLVDQIQTAFLMMVDEHGDQAHYMADDLVILVPRRFGTFKTMTAGASTVENTDGNEIQFQGARIEIIPCLNTETTGYAFIANSGASYGKSFTRVDELTLPVILDASSDSFVKENEVMLGAKYWREVGYGRPDEMLRFEVVQSS